MERDPAKWTLCQACAEASRDAGSPMLCAPCARELKDAMKRSHVVVLMPSREERIGRLVLTYFEKGGPWTFDFRRAADCLMRMPDATAETVATATFLHELADELERG